MKNVLSLIYRLILILTTTYGLYINFNHSSISRMIVYYTILSNISCLIFFTTIFIKQLLCNLKKNQLYYIIKLSLSVAILIIMIAFELIIRPYVHFKTGYSANNIRDTLVHIVVPIMVVLDYFLFDEKGFLKIKFLPYTIVHPILYTIFVLVYSNLGGTFRAFKQCSNYPYIFMDYDKLGGLSFLYCGMILILFILISFIWIKFDNVLSQKNNRL